MPAPHTSPADADADADADNLNGEQTAIKLGWSLSTLYRRMANGTAPKSKKVGPYRLFERAEVERFAASRRRAVR